MGVLRTLLASLILLVAGGVALAAATDGFQAFTSETARRLDVRRHPRPVPPTLLETQSGSEVNLADFRGKWLLVDFIYTRCPGYCSILGGEFAQLQTALARPLAQGRVVLLSISFDRDHDAPEQLSDYLRRFGDQRDGWFAVRPMDTAGLNDLEHIFGVTVIPDTQGGYIHNAAIEIVDPQGHLMDIEDMGDPAHLSQVLLGDMR
ncbi:MAG: SCO family protein [Gammaproteobacteria bacterium]